MSLHRDIPAEVARSGSLGSIGLLACANFALSLIRDKGKPAALT
jgi:hypothetical protein